MKYAELMQDYWDRRITNPRTLGLLGNIFNLLYAFKEMKPLEENPRSFYVNVAYIANCIIVFMAILPSLRNPAYNYLVTYGFMLFSLRIIIYVYNPDGLRETLAPEVWMMSVNT